MVVKKVSFPQDTLQATAPRTLATYAHTSEIRAKLNCVMARMQVPPNPLRSFQAAAHERPTKSSAVAQGVLGINLILRLRTLVQNAANSRLHSIVARMTSSHEYKVGAPSLNRQTIPKQLQAWREVLVLMRAR